MSYSSEVLTDSPLAYWRLDDAPAVAVDAAGGTSWTYQPGVTGSLSPLLSDGGYSVHGNGTNPICTISSVPTALNGANVTLEAWVSIPSTNVKGSFVKVGSSANGWGMGVGNTQWDNTGRKLILLSEAVAWHPTTYSFPAGAGTYHVMVVRGASGAVTAYVNGTSVWTGTLSSPITASGQMGVGGYTEGIGFKLSSTVNIDNVAMFASALSSTRVTAHYNSGSGDNSALSADSPTVWLKLDDTTVTSPTQFADTSGSSRPATIVGTPTLGVTAATAYVGGTAITLATGSYGSVATPAWMASEGALSVEAWFKTTGAANQAIVTMDNTSASPGATTRKFALYLDSAGKLTWMAFTSAGGFPFAATAGAYNDGNWHHVVATRTTTGMTIYVDGASAATQTISGTLSGTNAVDLLVGAISTSGGAGYPFNGSLDEVAVYSGALSSTRVSAHYTAGTTAGSVTGVVAATAPAPTVSISGTVTVTGEVSATAPAPTVAIAGTSTVTGVVAASAPAPTVEVTGSADDSISGVVTAVAPAPTVSIQGDILTTVTGTISATAPAPTVHIVDTTGDPALLGIRLGVETTDQTVTFETDTAELGIRLGIETNEVTIHAVETVNLGIRLGVRTFTPKAWGEDVRTGRPAPRLDIADRDGVLVATLPKSTLKPLTGGVNVMDKFGFAVERNDSRARLIESVAHEALLWRGNVLMSKGPIGPGITEGSHTSYDCADPRWHLADGRRRIGRIPKRQLLLNPGFTEGTNGLAHWVGGFDDGSNLEAPPEASVVAESYARSGKALLLGGVDKVVASNETLPTAAVFKGNRPYAWEPLADGFLPGGEAAITAIANTMTGPAPVVHITGHTADADGGTGQALSERRALAAKAVVLARWPSAVVTTEGKGETEPIDKGHTEAAYRKNRRVVFDFDATISAVGHRQFYRQWVTVTQPSSAKVPLPLTFAADMRIIEWLGAPADGWAILIRAKRGSTVIDEAYATMDEFTPRVRWAHYEATVEIPADGIATAVDVRLYPPAGSSRWANVGLWPQDQLGFFDVDQALIIKGIVEHVQDTSLGHGDLGIGTRTPLTGIPRTREYPYHERMPADTALEWFTSIDSGVDISYDPDRNQIVTHYPRQGSSTDLALVHGGRRSNVAAYKPLSTSALRLASNVIMQADGSGASRPEGYARDAAALGGALVEAVISAEEESPLSELDEGAASALAASLRARPGWEVTVSPDWTTRVLDLTGTGDTLRLVLPDEDVDGPHRLVASEWDPETDILTLTLIEEA